jgi:hypothetical protein
LGNKNYFCHDRIQEAAHRMIGDQDHCMHHMNYGVRNHCIRKIP